MKEFLEAMHAGAMKVFDINLRQNFYSLELIVRSLKLCNVLKINDEEFNAVSDMLNLSESIRQKTSTLISDYNLNALILTCGDKGSYVFTPSSESSWIETPKVNVVDTVGAGDSFAGAFCAAILDGKSIPQTRRMAVNVSAYVCAQSGAMPVLPQGIKDIDNQ